MVQYCIYIYIYTTILHIYTLHYGNYYLTCAGVHPLLDVTVCEA